MLPGINSPKLCLISSLLLIITYTLFGWYWRVNQLWLEKIWPFTEKAWLFWLIPGMFIVVLAALITGTFGKQMISQWFDSDRRTFFTVIVGCCLGVLMLIHYSIVAEILLLSCAMMLLQLDLYAADFHKVQSFFIIISVALVGMGTGGVLHWMMELYWPSLLPV